MRNKKYKHYDQDLKNRIIKSGDIGLAIRFGIPRNTARYWIEKAKVSKFKTHDKIQNKQISHLKNLLEKERAKLNLLKSLNEEIYLLKHEKSLTFEHKKNIVKHVTLSQKFIPLSSCLKIINISRSTFTRWKNYKRYCPISKQLKCNKKRSKNQLTIQEIETIKAICSRRKYKYLTFTSLYKIAIRTGQICCSKETWFKYVHKLNIFQSRNKTIKKKKYKIGIRAKKPNELWHIDITEIKTLDNRKHYLQVIIDNFSRKVLTWSLTSTKKANITFENLLKILKNKKNQILMSDKGSENKNNIIKYLVGNRIKQIIARTDTKYSNSIIEVFFRSLKSNFLSKIKLSDQKTLIKKLKLYIKKYNSQIPHSISNFLTPNEIYKNKSEESYKAIYLERLEQAKNKRFQENTIPCLANCA